MEDAPPPDQDRNDRQEPEDERQHGSSGRGLAAGYTLVGALVVGLGIGYVIDVAADTQPLWTVCGAILFMLAGLYQVVRDNLK